MMEVTLLLAMIAQRFRLTLNPGQTLEPLFSVTLRPKRWDADGAARAGVRTSPRK